MLWVLHNHSCQSSLLPNKTKRDWLQWHHHRATQPWDTLHRIQRLDNSVMYLKPQKRKHFLCTKVYLTTPPSTPSDINPSRTCWWDSGDTYMRLCIVKNEGKQTHHETRRRLFSRYQFDKNIRHRSPETTGTSDRFWSANKSPCGRKSYCFGGVSVRSAGVAN